MAYRLRQGQCVPGAPRLPLTLTLAPYPTLTLTPTLAPTPTLTLTLTLTFHPPQVRHGFPLGVNLKTKPMAYAAGMTPADYEWYLKTAAKHFWTGTIEQHLQWYKYALTPPTLTLTLKITLTPTLTLTLTLILI